MDRDNVLTMPDTLSLRPIELVYTLFLKCNIYKHVWAEIKIQA